MISTGTTERHYQRDHPRLVGEFESIGIPHLNEEDEGFWISKPWLKGNILGVPPFRTTHPLTQDWLLKRPKMHTPGQDDPPPDDPEYADNVLCFHEKLTPAVINRRRITAQVSPKVGGPQQAGVDVDDRDTNYCKAFSLLGFLSIQAKRFARCVMLNSTFPKSKGK